MRHGETGLPEEEVRRALARLGADPDSAPEVPAAVRARIGAALRAAPPPPAHSATAGLPRLSLPRVIALVLGIAALAVAAAIGVAVLLDSHPAPSFPAGPTAEKMTVPRSPTGTANPVTRP
jgi:hypothetical protein